MRLFEGQQLATVPDNVGIGDRGILAHHPRVIVERVERVEQRLARFVLPLPLRCAYPAIAVGNASIFYAKRMDHPVTGKPVVATAGCILRVGTIAEKGACDIPRDLAFNHEIGCIALHAERCIVAAKLRVIGKGFGHDTVRLRAWLDNTHSP